MFNIRCWLGLQKYFSYEIFPTHMAWSECTFPECCEVFQYLSPTSVEATLSCTHGSPLRITHSCLNLVIICYFMRVFNSKSHRSSTVELNRGMSLIQSGMLIMRDTSAFVVPSAAITRGPSLTFVASTAGPYEKILTTQL